MAEESLEKTQRYFFIALGIDMAVTAVSVASDFWVIDVLKTVGVSGLPASESAIDNIELGRKFSMLMIVTSCWVGWTLTRWIVACYAHAKEVLHATGFSQEKWIVTGWIVPFLNLFKPYQVLSEIYRAGTAGFAQSDEWKKTSGSGWLLTWWFFWSISHLVMVAALKAKVRNPASDTPTLSQIIGSYNDAILFCALSLVIAGLWFMVAGNLTKRLLKRSDRPFKQVALVENATHSAPASNDAYAAALAEIEENRIDKGTWARCYALSDGDESKAKAAYIKARVGVPKGAIADIEDVPEAQPIGLYEAAIGDKNQAYYVSTFDNLDQGSYGLTPSWNWAALLFTGGWALYRKMYGWFFICVSVLTMASLLYRSHGSEVLALIFLTVAWVSFAVFANSIYHDKVKSNILAAQKSIPDRSKLVEYLSSAGGVHIWVPPIVGAIAVIGIVVAVALPAYQDYSKRLAVARQVETPAPTVDWEEGVITPPPVKFGENDKIVTPAPPVDWSYTPAPSPEKQIAAPQLTPFTGTLDKFAPSTARPVDTEKAHFERIDAAHPDAESIVISSNFNSWVAKNPSYRPVVAKGTSQEVIDMLTRYKNER